ncbi:MAG: hypothetical protein IT430_01755 [Phycisphaerales bacterium]|nr:hypothetical protein [Phycisphaerales bacterium]
MRVRSHCSAALISLVLLMQAAMGSSALCALDLDPAQTSDPPAGNAMCPVITDEPIDPEIYSEYQGRRVYFCCQKCKRQFDRGPEPFMVNLAALDVDVNHEPLSDSPVGSTEQPEQHLHEEEHADDSHDLDHGTGLWPTLKWIGKFHPATVHFPIGLLLAAFIAECLFIATRRQWFDEAGRFCLWGGAIGAVVAALLGWLFGGIQLVDEDWLLTTHRWAGSGTALVSVIVLALSERLRWRHPGMSRGWLRMSLAAVALLAAAAGYFGGALVYGLNHYSWSS